MKPSAHRPLVLIVMGVSGSGKTTVGQLLARRTGAIFYEGDDFHPPENIVRMKGGIPLTDADREKWLQTLRGIVVDSLSEGKFAVMACSALKASYREKLQDGDSRVKFVFLTGPREVVEKRLKARRGHFMPPALLDSQLATLEPPADALTFSFEKSREAIVTELILTLNIDQPG